MQDKEFVVFVGPSGCGKSTTLRMIAGLEDISEGTCKIDGEVVNDLQSKDRHISMVFQNYALYPHLTVFENMAFPLRLDKKIHYYPWTEEELRNIDNKIALLKQNETPKNKKKIAQLEQSKVDGRAVKGYSQDEIFQKVTEAAKVLGITQYLTRKPKALSGGQRQRVAIGRAMVKDCKVFLMDEPLSNLDAKLRNQMRSEIILLRKKINTTFVYVTHDQTEAMTLGDRIVVMRDGFIMQVGTPTQVFDMPDNLFVAQFIGAPMMNTFKTNLVNEGGKYHVEFFGAKIPVDGEKGEALKKKGIPSREILLGVRPEHINLSKDGGASSIPVTIEVNEMMGSEYHLHVRTEDETKIIVRIPTINLTQEERESMVNGNKVNLTFESKAMHFFDPISEINLLADGEPVASGK
ncbi:MAG: ABC transporter ATP-binding protein [Bacilli bacterium]|nr:ABC transporter ATP-binding protein [Bacilli bacterium]